MTVRQETTRDVDWIARAIGVTQFSRLGLRVSLLWEGEDRAQVIDMLLSKVLPIQQQGWSQAGQVTGGDLILHLTADRLTTRIAISSVVNVLREERVTIPGQDGVPPPVDLDLIPDFALNVDVDLADSRITDSLDVKPHLNRSVDYLQGILIPFISHLLQENS